MLYFHIWMKRFGTLFFFYIVPVPFVPSRKLFGTIPIVPRDGTFRDFSGFGTVPQDSSKDDIALHNQVSNN